MVERSDGEWIALCREGDEQAFAQLVVKYQKPVYNMAWRITHSQELAEEITQATFVKVFEKLDTYQAELPFFSWLYRIGLNEAINETKRNRRRATLDERSLVAETTTSFETTDAIEQALMLLSPEERALIILRHLQNLGYEEIAYIMDRSASRVKSQLFRARHSLKTILGRMGINNEN